MWIHLLVVEDEFLKAKGLESVPCVDYLPLRFHFVVSSHDLVELTHHTLHRFIEVLGQSVVPSFVVVLQRPDVVLEMADFLEFFVKRKNPNKSEKEIVAMVEQKTTGVITETEWTEIIK